jgi:DNA polymerase III psi subunit
MFSGPYVVINQLIKSIWKAMQLKNSLLYMLREKNINPTKNDQDWDFWKYGPNPIIQKSIVICSLKKNLL